MNDNYLTIKDVAKKLSISERTAWTLVHDRIHPLPTFRIGRKIVRVKESELHEWMDKHFRMDPQQIDTIVDEVIDSLGL
ncbi:transcriptional regulator, AlpA family [Desulfacinum infernum DSM 9756]|uniref:Transcriptional regulator, AlpA family n=1 Tax=Desulfacinum infernum DSM 9756 TaxID=1121391 RepID=A0A1M5HG45_9BACT|nr:helix-turn-helix domain-containing protein [Desulfacinum infernum]MBC7358454.1 helix-turn-helix domain-containing protein [Desulfacinum sp.]SHG14934.1 transcriptional regulator, AlpA family [Desulfacinum infernum DSM 9756]